MNYEKFVPQTQEDNCDLAETGKAFDFSNNNTGQSPRVEDQQGDMKREMFAK